MRTLTLFCLMFTAIWILADNWEDEDLDYSIITSYDMGIWTKGLYQNSLVLDSDRLPHVAYFKYTNSAGYPHCEIWYCTAYGDFDKEYVGYVPAITSVQPPPYVPDVALVLDSSENPHIFVATFDNGYGRSVFHYYKSGGNWTHEPIEFHPNGSEQVANTRIKISAKQDASGYFHVVYSMNWVLSGNGYRIRYATNKSGSWVVTDAYYNNNAGVITGCDLEVCTSDWPMISFVEKTASNTMRIRYTWYEEHVDEQGVVVHTWNPSTIDELSSASEIDTLGETQLEINSDNQPMVSYFLPYTTVYNSRFMIALRDQQGWHKDEIDSSSSYAPGVYNSLALKASDEPDVTYSRQNYMWFGIYDGSWDLSCIFQTSISGLYNHLVLDPTDDSWYMTQVCNASGYSHLFIQWWDQTKSGNGLARQQKRASFSINSIYPLPARNCINCTYSASQAGQINMSLYDLSGRLVSKGSIVNLAGDGVFTYDVSNLATGIYTVRASSAGLVANKKIIVAH